MSNLLYHDFPIEDIGSLVINDALVVLMAFTVRLSMVHQGIMIRMLVSFKDTQSLKGRFQVFPVVIEIQVVTGECPTKREGMHAGMALCLLRDISIVNQGSLERIVLQFVVVQMCFFGYKYFRYGIGQHLCLGEVMVHLNHLQLGTLPYGDDITRLETSRRRYITQIQ